MIRVGINPKTGKRWARIVTSALDKPAHRVGPTPREDIEEAARTLDAIAYYAPGLHTLNGPRAQRLAARLRAFLKAVKP